MNFLAEDAQLFASMRWRKPAYREGNLLRNLGQNIHEIKIFNLFSVV